MSTKKNLTISTSTKINSVFKRTQEGCMYLSSGQRQGHSIRFCGFCGHRLRGESARLSAHCKKEHFNVQYDCLRYGDMPILSKYKNFQEYLGDPNVELILKDYCAELGSKRLRVDESNEKADTPSTDEMVISKHKRDQKSDVPRSARGSINTVDDSINTKR